MAAYRATQHDATGYSPNMLVLGRETRVPPDLVYGAPDEDVSGLTYDKYVAELRDKAVEAFHDVRVSLQKSANRNKKYYDLGLKQQQFATGDWVLYFNPRKLRGKQMKWVRQFEGPFLVVSKPTSLTAKIQRSQKAQIRVVHIDKLKHFTGTPPKAWRLPDEIAGSSANSSSAMAGSNSAGQGSIESPPAIARDGHTDPSVVDRHIQFSTVEGSHPDVVTTSGQSAVQDATTPIGIEMPTGVRKRVRSRGRENFVQPMGMANFVRGDSGKFSAPMGAREFEGDLLSPGSTTRSHAVSAQFSVPMGARKFEGDLLSPGSATGSHGVSEQFSAPMGAREFSGVRVAEGQHGTNGVDHATNRFWSGWGRHESGAATPSDVADRRGIETRQDRLGASSAGANVVARGRLANEPSLHVGSAALPSGSMNANADVDRSGADHIADLQDDSMSSSNASSDCARARNTAESVVRP